MRLWHVLSALGAALLLLLLKGLIATHAEPATCWCALGTFQVDGGHRCRFLVLACQAIAPSDTSSTGPDQRP